MFFVIKNTTLQYIKKNVMCMKYIQKTISHCKHDFTEPNLIYGKDVILAKENNCPIVALESAIITHGMPYPDNLETALEVEKIIRQKGVTPATIAVIDGKIKVGITSKEIENLAKTKRNSIKISRRDLSYAISQGLCGGTTVSGTIIISKKSNIPIVATGGIGGVHRQVCSSMDVSADLNDLGNTPIAVVCSGVKAILDISKTLEYLETIGVPVVTMGEKSKFPAFYSQQTADGLESPLHVPNAKEVSHLIAVQTQLALKTGILIAIPVPECFSLNPHEIDILIDQSLKVAELKKVYGKNITPFVLNELASFTNGHCLRSNKALVKNNAGVAAEIALHLADIKSQSYVASNCQPNDFKTMKNPVIIGGASLDTILILEESTIKLDGSTHKCRSRQAVGGVGRNIAAALENLRMNNTKLLSVVGSDDFGQIVYSSLEKASSTVQINTDVKTARYTTIVDIHGNCCFGLGEMEAYTNINKTFLKKNLNIIKETDFLIIDGNISKEAIKFVIEASVLYNKKIWYEPTDVHKALNIFQHDSEWKKVLHFISPNINELMIIADHFNVRIPSHTSMMDIELIKIITEELAKHIPVIITTLGAQGVLVTRKSTGHDPFYNVEGNLIDTGNIQSRLYPPLHCDQRSIISVSGCGDCLAAGIIFGIMNGWKESSCVLLGLHAAKLSLFSIETVPQKLTSLSLKEDDYYIKQ